MKVDRQGEDFEFVLTTIEKDLLVQILNLYPRTLANPNRLTLPTTGHELEESRKLLDESLTASRKQARQKLDRWLGSSSRFASAENGFRLRIDGRDLEWFLQILNELKIGSWMRLGAPDERIDWSQINKVSAIDLWLMRAAEIFQDYLLRAIRGEE